MPPSRQLLLQVLQAPEGSALAEGTSWPIVGSAAVIGRSPTADVMVADRTVSREHVRIHVGPPTSIEVLTSSNGTFIDQLAVEPGSPVPLGPEGARLQLGGVLLGLVPLAATEPVLEPLGMRSPARALLSVTWDAGQCLVRCGDRDLGLTGAPARLLGVLAGRAGEVVHHWDLEQELGTLHLAPLVTAVRKALADAMDAGVLSESLLRERLSQATGDDAGERHQLMRQVVQSRRGHGYVLHLQAADVAVQQV